MDFKVKCVRVKSYPEYFTEGKVYDVVNGSILADEGTNFDTWSDPKCDKTYSNTFECLKKWFKRWYDFELVEDKKVFTKSDLKNGDVVVLRDGTAWITIVDLNMFVGMDGWNDFTEFNEDLTDIDEAECFDIVKVYRPTDKYHCQCYEEAYTEGELIYDREGDTEPTQLYNGKVVCIDLNGKNKDNYTVGKIYEFKDGRMTCDCGHIFGKDEPFHTFEDWKEFTGSKFIEVVE